MIIKNKFLALILLTALIGLAANQGAFAQMNTKHKAGIKVGLNASNLYVDNVHDENARLGINAGVFGEIVSTEAFALQAELLYSNKGSFNVFNPPFSQEVDFNLNYIDLPLLAVIKLGAVDLHVGAYASYLVDANIKYNGTFTGTEKLDKDNFKSFDYGLVGGVGVNFGMVQVGARYNYGLVKIAESNGAKNLIGDSKNSLAQLFVAFDLTKQ